MEQARWNQANIDHLFYAGSQTYVNNYFNFTPHSSYQQYYFNLIQQPINLITGYQRQHRKNFGFQAFNGGDPQTTDQYTRIITNAANQNGFHETFSKSCEQAAIGGMVLMQPYLDFTGEDPAQGDLKIKLWEYNAFMLDPYFREFDMSDCQYAICQEYISQEETKIRFKGQEDLIRPMMGAPTQYGNFYFLPENQQMNRNDLNVLTYAWYRWQRKRKKLYSKTRNQFFDFAPGEEELNEVLYGIDDLEMVTVTVPTWKVAVILNEQLMWQGENPLGFDQCPFVMVPWNYEPHLNNPDLRSRSLIRPMRDPQFLFNYKIITNNEITSATINAGWKRKVGAVANEDNLKKTGQGWDVLINEGYELTDCEKIIPSGVPESDIVLGQEMADLIFRTSGINLENWSGQNDKQISSLTLLMKQAANLMVFQKYFDQWDFCLRLLGDLLLKIVLHGWNASKVSLYLGEEPTPYFFSRIFTKYKSIVEESDLTPTQQNLQAQEMLEINQMFGREVFPPSLIIPKLNITGKGELVPYLQKQEEQLQQQQQEQQIISQSFDQARMQELMSRATANIAMARERHGRSEANIGLFEERLSEITRNRALATKDKMDALEKLVDVIAKYGEIETQMKMNQIESFNADQVMQEDREKIDAKQTALANEFKTNIMGSEQQQQQEPVATGV